MISNLTRSIVYPTTLMNSPAPNIPGATSAMSPFTKYMNKLELEATLKDDIRAGDETPTLSLYVARMPRFMPLASASVVAQHLQVARQRRRKERVILLRLEQWQPSKCYPLAGVNLRGRPFRAPLSVCCCRCRQDTAAVARRRQIDKDDKEDNHLRAPPTHKDPPSSTPSLFSSNLKKSGRIYSYHWRLDR